MKNRAAARRGTGLLLFAAVFLFAVPQAALLPLLDRDEPRFAEASREMLQSRNFVVPTFNGAPRYAKPPLVYWLQAVSFRLCGENALAARLPSLLATAGTALVLFLWGTELEGISAGLIAALAYGLCFQAMQQGRVATADALLVFFVAVTGWSGWKLLAVARSRRYWRNERPPRAWNLWGAGLALAFAGGFLAKGPEALVPFLPLILCSMGGGPRFAFRLLAILLLGMLLVAAWAIPAYLQTGGAYWRVGLGHDVGDRMFNGFEGHGAGSPGGYILLLPLYLVLFWISALPWSPLLILQRRRLFARAIDSIDEVYLLANAGLYFVIFTCMVTKLPHYTLPAFPFLALFFARRWCAAGLAPEKPLRLLLGFGTAAALLALSVIPAWVLPKENPSPVGTLVREAGPALTRATGFALVDYTEPNAIWEMRRVAQADGQLISEGEIAGFLAQPGPQAVILTTEAWARFQGGRNATPGEQVFFAHGWNAGRVRSVDLVLIVKTAP